MVRGNKIKDVRLTVEEIDQHGDFLHLPLDQKERLISFVYDVSLSLYKSYGEEHD